jgi:hypothetical protein
MTMHFDWDRFTYDEAWLRQAVQTEVDSDWDAQIGANPSLPPKPSAPQLQAQLRQVKILSLLFQELHALLQQANLGAATEATSIKGRQLIHQQIANLSPQQQAYFEALLEEEKTTLDDRPLRAQLPQVLRNLLSPEDWQEIAQVAMSSIQTHFMEQISLQRSA